jgi:hypothetical protein
MHHHICHTEEILSHKTDDSQVNIKTYNDVYVGSDYLKAVNSGHISPNDMTFLLLINRVQLYQNKACDCWIFIWVVFDLPPEFHYKKKYVLIATIIPSLHHLKFLESFLYTSLHHLIALQKEGLQIFDPICHEVFHSKPFFHFGIADSVGIIHLNGLTGHKGAYNCQLYCAVKGHCKPGSKTYYPALLKPENYNVPGSNHNDINIHNISAAVSCDYQYNLQHILSSPSNGQYAI